MNTIPKQLVSLVHHHDSFTFLHIKRVSLLMEAFAIYMNLSREEVNLAKWGGLLHDIGKIDVDHKLLHKPKKLSSEEFMTIKTHAANGYDILRYFSVDRRIQEMARWHHERWDGNGYPDQLHGKHTPLLCRMLCIVDAWEAMTGKRTYRASIPVHEAIGELRRGKGTQFDSQLVDHFLEVVDNSTDILHRAFS